MPIHLGGVYKLLVLCDHTSQTFNFFVSFNLRIAIHSYIWEARTGIFYMFV